MKLLKNELTKRILSSIILIPIIFFFILKGLNYFIFFLIILFLISAYEWHKIQKNKFFLFLGIFFLSFSFFCAYLLRGDNFNSLIEFLFIIVICIATDTGGYIFGKIFKGIKLTKISPNKTYSGVIGSYFLSICFAFLYLSYLKTISLDFIFSNSPNVIFSLLIILIISTISQIGDLIVSFFKRQSNIKDISQLLPGHGGILDRIDGIIFAVPFSYFLFKFIQ